MNKLAVVSRNVPQICSALEQFGFELIYSDSVDGFISYEQNHADMQCLVVDNKVFVLSQCKELGSKLIRLGIDVIYTSKQANGKYPENVLLNAKIIGKTIIGKMDSLDRKVVEYCKKSGYHFINVNQGYTSCSCVNINNNAIITADSSIYNALANTDIDVLKISQGHIVLDGAGENTYGFIGGSSVMLDKENLLFFGKIENHPDYNNILKFCSSKNVNIHSIKNIPLTDIGSAISLNF